MDKANTSRQGNRSLLSLGVKRGVRSRCSTQKSSGRGDLLSSFCFRSSSTPSITSVPSLMCAVPSPASCPIRGAVESTWAWSTCSMASASASQGYKRMQGADLGQRSDVPCRPRHEAGKEIISSCLPQPLVGTAQPWVWRRLGR